MQINKNRTGIFAYLVRCLGLVLVPNVYYLLTNYKLAFLLIPVLLISSPLFALVSALCAVLLILLSAFVPVPTLVAVVILAQTGIAVLLSFSSRFVSVNDQGSIASGFGLKNSAVLRAAIAACLCIDLFLSLFRSVDLVFLACVVIQTACVAGSLWRLPGPRSRIDAAGLLTALVSTTLSLVILEVGSWYVAPAVNVPSNCFEPTPDYVYTLRPGSRGSIALTDDSGKTVMTHFNISEQGLREDRVYGPKAPDEFRIVVLGDSFTMGHGLTMDQTYGRVLEKYLTGVYPGKRIVVINMGVWGYAPWQEIGFLEKRGFKLEPDLVIWQIFPPNDISGTYSRVNKLLRAFGPYWERRYFLFRKQNEFPVRAERWLQSHLNVYALIASISNGEGPVMSWLADFRFLPKYEYPELVPQTNRHNLREPCLATWYPELTEAFEMMCADIRALKAECDRRGIDLIAFANSDNISLFPDAWDEMAKRGDGSLYEVNKDIRLTQECFESAGIPYVDITAKMMPLPNEVKSRIFFLNDGHFTPTGAHEVASLLAEYLKNEYFPGKLK
ncbi:MAG: hypothetical protein K1Y02_19300 [Candidatus Hydrogenedentes bacterium]|nr:hypothetical protein [Candidatus Hydrogenedentota bacterium]